MISRKQPNWQRDRSDFNHQWLKNRLLSALDAADNVIKGRVRSIGYLQELIDVDIPEWQERRKDLHTLLNDFESQMSPQQFILSSPLSDCEEPVKETLAELMHELWLVRYPVQEWLDNAKNAAEEVNLYYEHLRNCKPIDSDGNIQPEFVTYFDAFRSSCRKLSKAIEQFPNQILIT